MSYSPVIRKAGGSGPSSSSSPRRGRAERPPAARGGTRARGQNPWRERPPRRAGSSRSPAMERRVQARPGAESPRARNAPARRDGRRPARARLRAPPGPGHHGYYRGALRLRRARRPGRRRRRGGGGAPSRIRRAAPARHACSPGLPGPRARPAPRLPGAAGDSRTATTRPTDWPGPAGRGSRRRPAEATAGPTTMTGAGPAGWRPPLAPTPHARPLEEGAAPAAGPPRCHLPGTRREAREGPGGPARTRTLEGVPRAGTHQGVPKKTL